MVLLVIISCCKDRKSGNSCVYPTDHSQGGGVNRYRVKVKSAVFSVDLKRKEEQGDMFQKESLLGPRICGSAPSLCDVALPIFSHEKLCKSKYAMQK